MYIIKGVSNTVEMAMLTDTVPRFTVQSKSRMNVLLDNLSSIY